MYFKPDLLEAPGSLTEYDYRYLLGDAVFWPAWGAALGVVHDWCRNNGYGDFGEPSEKGKAAMEDYERKNMGSG